MPHCSFLRCGSRTEKGNRLFSLPQGDRNEERRNAWIKNINRKSLPTNTFVCEKHFAEDQFENNRKDGRRPLKCNAIPTIFENYDAKFVEKDLKTSEVVPSKRSRRSSRTTQTKKYEEYSSEEEEEVEEPKIKNEASKNKQIKICTSSVRCRACLTIFPKSTGHILKKRLLGKPLKDRILMFIPQLTPTLLETEYICVKCCRLILKFTTFYESCLDTDMKLRNGQISLSVVVNDTEEESQEQSEEKDTGTPSTPQKRKRKQDLVTCRDDDTEEVQKNNEEKILQPTVPKKRGRPRKFPKEEHVDDASDKEGSTVITCEKEGQVDDSCIEKEEENASKDTSRQEKDTVDDAGDEEGSTDITREEEKGIIDLSDSEDSKGELLQTEEKGNGDQKKDELQKELDNYDHQIFTDHDYVHGSFHCPDCQTDYRTAKGMKSHLTSFHKILEEQEFQCIRCNMKFIRFKDMVKHKNDHGSPCDLCEEIFSSSEDLETHKKVHPEMYCCMKCGSNFKQEEMLTIHSSLHDLMTKVVLTIRRSSQTYQCKKCELFFPAKQKIMDHVKTVHLKIKDVPCLECDKKFCTRNLMMMHKRNRHSNEKRHKCDICERSFARSDHLANHRLTHSFTDPNRRTYSRTKVDAGKQYQCSFCLTITSTKQLLITHLSEHANERRFECRYCGLKLSSIRTKMVHEKTHESDPESQFVCMICWKRFPNEETLKSHEVKHTLNIKRFSCCLCGANFTRKIILENHLLDLHIKTPNDTMDENINNHVKMIEMDWETEDKVEGQEEEEIIIENIIDDNEEGLNMEEDNQKEQISFKEQIKRASIIILDDNKEFKDY